MKWVIRGPIHAKNKFDFVGNIRRGNESKDINETARMFFHEAVASLFGGESRIPKSVFNAMKWVLLYHYEGDILVLTLTDTGTHADLWL